MMLRDIRFKNFNDSIIAILESSIVASLIVVLQTFLWT